MQTYGALKLCARVSWAQASIYGLMSYDVTSLFSDSLPLTEGNDMRSGPKQVDTIALARLSALGSARVSTPWALSHVLTDA